MALAYSSDNIANNKYVPASAPHSAREVYRAAGTVILDDAVAMGHLIGLCVLPANCIPTDIKVLTTDLDSDTTMVIDVGVLNADKDDLVPNSLLIEGSAVCQAGGVADMDTPDCVLHPADWLAEVTCPGYDAAHASASINSEKVIAVLIDTAAGTPVAGTMYVLLDYRSAENGV